MRELCKLGVEVHAVIPDEGPLSRVYRENGIQVHRVNCDFPLNHPWLLPGRIKRLKRLVGKVQPDLIHSHFVGTTLILRMAMRGKIKPPRIFQVPGPLHLEKTFFRTAEISTAGPGDYWIATCRDTQKRYLAAGVAPQRVFMSYYGCDVDGFRQISERGKLRAELNIGHDTPLVGMVAYMYAPKKWAGQIRGIKGHEDLIDAIALAAETIPDIKVVFIGGPWDGAHAYEKAIHNYARHKIPGRAYFSGTRHDVAELYPDFDVAVHPSHSENLGGAAESLLMEIPTIAANVGGFPDLVIPGHTGALVAPRQPVELARAIVHMMRNLEQARQMAVRGRARVIAACDVRDTAKQVLGIYRQVLSTA